MSDIANRRLFSEIQAMISNIIYLLTITVSENNTDLTTFLQFAYDVIKDRKGKIINWKFLKESNL